MQHKAIKGKGKNLRSLYRYGLIERGLERRDMPEREEVETLLVQVAMDACGSFGLLYARSSAKLFGIAWRVLKGRGEAGIS